MTTGIRFAVPATSGDIDVGLSPLAETALSLHALCGRRRHPLQHAWARQARSLPPPVRRRIRSLRFAFRFVVPDMLLAQRADGENGFEAELGRVESLAVERFALDMLRPLYDHGGRDDPSILRDPAVRRHALAAAAHYGHATDPVRLLFDDPEALRADLVTLLREYWDAAFADEWNRLRPALAQTGAQLRRTIRDGGPYRALRRFGPLDLDVEREEIGLDLPHHHRVEVTPARRLSLVASAYAWPHVHVNCDEPWPLLLVLPLRAARDASLPLPPPSLGRSMRALGDERRLQLLRLLARRPHTAQELAPLMRLSQSGLSRHLSALRAAGLIVTERDGYWRVHRAQLEALDDAFAELDAFVRPPAPDDR